MLTIPLIQEYYELQEILTFYGTIKLVHERRDFYSILFEKTESFLNIKNAEENIKILDTYIFSHNKQITESAIELSNNDIRNLHPIGFNLLNLVIPFDALDLKKAYRSAAKKYHPDIGGDEDDMKNLNDAYITYQEFLNWDHYSKSNERQNIHKFFQINNATIFCGKLFIHIIRNYIDIWELEKAYTLITYLMDSNFIDSYLMDSYFTSDPFRNKIDNAAPIIGLTISLSERFAAAEKYDIAQELFDKSQDYRKKYPNMDEKNWNENIKKDREFLNNKSKDIVAGVIKPRIDIRHILQAHNAYKINAISEKRYKKYLQKFENEELKNILSAKILKEYFIGHSFIELSFDKKIKFSSVATYIPHIYYFESKNVYEISKEQQNEYYSTFYLHPTVALIKKYLYVRICSYILSIETYKDRINYLPSIINECHLFNNIYKNERVAYKSSQVFIENLISDLRTIVSLNEADFTLSYKKLKEKYEGLLPIGEKFRSYSKSNEIDSPVNKIE